ncbi:MAG: DUF1080 domain-containing protein [Opitutaceae bacterium]
MKPHYLLAVSLLVTVGLRAQDATKKSGPTFPPPSELQPETLAQLSQMTPLFDGKTLEGWIATDKIDNPADITQAWTVKDGAMASLGAGRGMIYTKKSYGNYRLVFQMRHLSGAPDHQACVVVFCAPPAEAKALDTLDGIQVQPPNGGKWDYRPGKNNDGKELFTRLPHPRFDAHEWSQVELLVNADEGTVKMAVAQPVGTKAYAVLDFKDATAGRPGPFGWQMHNKGLFDEFRDVRIEVDPKTDRLITVETGK